MNSLYTCDFKCNNDQCIITILQSQYTLQYIGYLNKNDTLTPININKCYEEKYYKKQFKMKYKIYNKIYLNLN